MANTDIQREQSEAEVVDGELVIHGAETLAVQSKTEIDQQIATAKRFPRSITKFIDMATSLATSNQRVAERCNYCLPARKAGGEPIEGPTIRLAEIAACSYTNLRYGSTIIEVGDKFVVAQGFCFDLENNNAYRHEVRRRITDKNGKRYKDDMIGMTCNAACAIALREAIFHVVPRVLVEQVYEEAMRVAFGNAKTLDQTRDDAMRYLQEKHGISADRVFLALGIEGMADMDRTRIRRLKGIVTAIQDGVTTADEAFPSESPAEKAEAMKARVEKAEAPKPKEPAA